MTARENQQNAACHRIRVLMLAFACEPDEGSEPEVGWKWAMEMARTCTVTVITQTKNRRRIEEWLQHHSHPEHLHFSYLELSRPLRAIKKSLPGGMYLYYALWQMRLRHMVSRLLRTESFDLIHHVTFASFRMPVWVRGLPVVWGPVGGAELAPARLMSGHGSFSGRMREHVRNFSTIASGFLVRSWEPTGKTGGVAIASTPDTEILLSKSRISCHRMPAIGYDVHADCTSPPCLKSGELKLVFIGRLHLLKGIHLLLQALVRIADIPVSLSIYGNGPEKERLAKLTRHLGLESRVTFHGHVPRTSIENIMACHDVVIAPSLYESGGLSVIEGFAQARPAIVLDCGGHALSVDASCGMKIPVQASQEKVIEGLADAIRHFATNREEVSRQGINARNRLMKNYSWATKREKMLEIYESVIKRS